MLVVFHAHAIGWGQDGDQQQDIVAGQRFFAEKIGSPQESQYGKKSKMNEFIYAIYLQQTNFICTAGVHAEQIKDDDSP